jgi:hypothetical protein
VHMNLEALALERDRNDARDLEILRAGLAALGDSTLNSLTRSVPKSSPPPALSEGGRLLVVQAGHPAQSAVARYVF